MTEEAAKINPEILNAVLEGSLPLKSGSSTARCACFVVKIVEVSSFLHLMPVLVFLLQEGKSSSM
jgi:hypothetical protein